jgi:hypothetical protein
LITINGDGLDDLIVSAYKGDPNSKSEAGKTYVVFGKANNSAIEFYQIQHKIYLHSIYHLGWRVQHPRRPKW